MLTTSAIVTCASTVASRCRSSSPASSKIGSRTAADPVASSSAKTAGCPAPWNRLAAHPGSRARRLPPAASSRAGMHPTSALVADRRVHAGGEHQHREAHVGEEHERVVARVQPAEARASDDERRRRSRRRRLATAVAGPPRATGRAGRHTRSARGSRSSLEQPKPVVARSPAHGAGSPLTASPGRRLTRRTRENRRPPTVALSNLASGRTQARGLGRAALDRVRRWRTRTRRR